MIVVDASVVIAFLLDSPRAPDARAVRARNATWVTPPLCQSEVLNALLQETKVRKIALHDALDAAGSAARLLTYRAEGCEHSTILTTAHSTGLTAYDATYAVLARSLGVLLVTEDKQILRACPDVARSMKHFLAPPGARLTVREERAEYRPARRGVRRRKA